MPYRSQYRACHQPRSGLATTQPTNNVHVSTNLLSSYRSSLQFPVRRPCHFGTRVYFCISWTGNRISRSCFHEHICFRQSPTSTGFPLHMRYSVTEVQMTFGGMQYHRVPWIRIGLPNIATQKTHIYSFIWVVWF